MIFIWAFLLFKGNVMKGISSVLEKKIQRMSDNYTTSAKTSAGRKIRFSHIEQFCGLCACF